MRLFLDFFNQLYLYREYLIESVRRDLRVKYKRSALGYVWTVLHPLGMMIILTVVFSHVIRTPIPFFAVFLLGGLLTWNYFSSTVMMALGSIRHHQTLLAQVPVPKYLFLLSLAFSNLVNCVLVSIPLLIVMMVTGAHISWVVLTFPLMLLPLIIFTIGVSLLVATSNVFFDDTLHLSEVALQAMYFTLPLLYQRDFVPPEVAKFLVLNPLFGQIEFIRGIFYSGTLPSLSTYGINLIGSCLVLATGLYVFRKAENKFLYYV